MAEMELLSMIEQGGDKALLAVLIYYMRGFKLNAVNLQKSVSDLNVQIASILSNRTHDKEDMGRMREDIKDNKKFCNRIAGGRNNVGIVKDTIL